MTLCDATRVFASTETEDLDQVAKLCEVDSSLQVFQDRRSAQCLSFVIEHEVHTSLPSDGDLMSHTRAPVEYVYNYCLVIVKWNYGLALRDKQYKCMIAKDPVTVFCLDLGIGVFVDDVAKVHVDADGCRRCEFGA